MYTLSQLTKFDSCGTRVKIRLPASDSGDNRPMTMLVFVYGTLKTGLPNHHLIENKTDGLCVARGSAVTVDRFPLVIASRYNIPFMLYAPGNGKNVSGELYEVDETRLKSLDALEAHPNFYERQDLVLRTPERDTIQAQAYFLVKYRPCILDLQVYGSYDNSIEGKIYISPFSRPDAAKERDDKHWWCDVHSEYEDTKGETKHQS